MKKILLLFFFWRIYMLENRFQKKILDELKIIFPNAIFLKNDSSIIQGFPDLLILNGNKWAALEVKTSRLAKVQPNQKYYIDVLDSMSYASFIFPENEKDVLNELQKALRIRGTTRFFRG